MDRSKIRTFIAEGDDNRTVIRSDGIAAITRFSSNPSWYVRLSQTEEDFYYEWNHSVGKGKVRIPVHIIFDLPELLTVLNVASSNRIFYETRVYENHLIATLFPK